MIMEKKFKLEKSDEIDSIKELVLEFFKKVLEDEEQPYFVSDSTTIYDVSVLEDKELIDRIEAAYTKKIESSELEMPLWRLIKIIQKNK